MNWMALIGVAAFGGALLFGFQTGTMPVAGVWSPFRDEEPGWFWLTAGVNAFGLIVSFAAFIGLLS